MNQQVAENNNNSEIRVLIVDDHELVRHGFKSLLGSQQGITVVDTLIVVKMRLTGVVTMRTVLMSF